MAGYVTSNPTTWRLLKGTAALKCLGGIIGGAVAGAANDTLLMGVFIQKNAGPGVLTVAGFLDTSGNAGNLVIQGSTTLDVAWFPPAPILNEFGALSFTPSVDGVIWVATRCFTGGE